jgi:hypothetical protein
LCGYNKCYLARPKVTHSYLTMIARDFYRELAARGVGDFSVYRPPTPAT